MHSPPSQWFVLPASVIWAGLHVPRRWDEKKVYSPFFGGEGVGWGCFVFFGFWDFCFCLNVFFLVVASLNAFGGAVKWCNVFVFYLFLVNSCECFQRFSIVSFEVEIYTMKLMVLKLPDRPNVHVWSYFGLLSSVFIASKKFQSHEVQSCWYILLP